MMNTLRIAVSCALVGWMAADARAQLGTYGAPDPISWSHDNTAYGGVPMVAARTTYVSTTDGSVTTQNMPTNAGSGLGPMLADSGPTVAPATGGQTTIMPPGGYVNNPGNCDTCGDGCWDNCCRCGCGCCGCWYATFDYLYMTRDQPNKVFTSAQAAAQVNQGHFDEFNWTSGGQVTVGYRFGCCCDWALEATYWGLADSPTDGSPNITGPYVTPFIFGLTDILGTTGGGGTGGAQTANNYFDNSPNHHIWRDWQVNNVEVNLVKNLCGGPCSCCSVDFLVGIRWFQFRDGLIFGAQRANDGTAYANDWIFLNDHISNDLIGAQIGFDASYRFCDCWRAFIRPEVGIYDNHMSLNYNLYAVSSTTGQQFQASSQTYANPNYPVHSTNDGFAFLTQVDVGLDWQVTRHVSLQGGYRIVAVTGVGLADNQIPFYGNDTQAIADIDRNGSLIVHGAFAGFTVCW
jgi:hypothetical protein